MDVPDTSDMDLDPTHFRCPADLWYRLRQLWEKAGYPSYRELSERTGVADSTLSDLIGENSKTRNNRNKPLWDTVKRFVLGCGVPDTELEAWEAAWEASVAQDKPTWPEEQQQLLAKIDQLTADLTVANTRTNQLTADLAEAKARIDQLTTDFATAEKHIDQLTTVVAKGKTRIDQLTAAAEAAKTRATAAEAALAAYHQAQSAVLRLPEPLEQLRIKAETCYDARDYTGAIKLYRKIATETQREYGSGHVRTLQARYTNLVVEAQVFKKAFLGQQYPNPEPRPLFQHSRLRKLHARWRCFVREYQRGLPEGSRTTLELRLEYIYWTVSLFGSLALKPRKLLIGLHADCKLFLPPGHPFTAQVAEYVRTGDKYAPTGNLASRHPKQQWWSLELRLPHQDIQ